MSSSVLETLYAPVIFVAGSPSRPFLFAFVFVCFIVITVVINEGKIRYDLLRLQLWTSLAWIIFGANELYSHLNKIDIRVGLLITGPAIILFSLYTTFIFIKSIFEKYGR